MLVSTDLLVVTVTVFAAQYFGGVRAPARDASPFELAAHIPPTSSGLLAFGMITVWMLALSVSGSRSPRVVGTGAAEYRRVVHVTFVVFGTAGLLAYVLSIDGLEWFLAIALAVGLVGLLANRWAWRKWLARRRRDGQLSSRVLLVGSESSIATIARDLGKSPEAGFKVVGACTPSGIVSGTIPGTDIPMSGSMNNLIEALDAVGADTVVITSSNELAADKVRELSWKLEPGRHHLVVAPSLTDIGGPRLHTRPVAGLPLIHVETPRYDGGKLYAKRLFDIILSGALILFLSPVLLGIALIVRLSTPGSVIFRQDRIGRRGEHFEMLKFRSMYEDAEARLADLAALDRDEGNSVMFKMKDDPRVTPIGRILRRYSLDELPQLFNVFLGSMSIVGPRPPLEREVEQYARHVHRRFLVKPGITGLWQVSGRSNLDWDETVRLDLFYVENWTMTGDLIILWKTFRAVVGSDGAY
ncbi:sugar transferase [Agromyces salentinus]|uniref:Sugar transferase n=1 Tax=Agromyces salentinus TaxID=269421 RepID=A0ABP4Z7A0_9MICO